MNEYERDSLKQQILYLKNELNALQEEKNNLTSISSMYQTKALYWQEIAEKERKKNKEYISKIEMLNGLLDSYIRVNEEINEEYLKGLEVIHELQQLVKEPSKKFIKLNYKE